MSCSSRRIVAAATLAGSVLAAALAGCGFRPLYGPSGGSADLAAVAVAPIPERTGQELRTELIDLLDPGRAAAAPRYRLAVSLSEERERFSVERTGFASRANLRIEAAFTLVDAATGAPVLAGTTHATSSYDILDRTTDAPRDASKFSTLTADHAARSRVVRQLAQDIRRRLAVHFAHAPQPGGPQPSG